METRVCKTCGEEKPVELFTKNKACKGGYTNLCRTCANMAQTIFRSKNREYVNLQAKEYSYKKHPIRARKAELLTHGKKICSKCGCEFELSEFRKRSCICFKCRNGHERGYYQGLDNDGRYKKRFTDEEQKIKRIRYAKEWARRNPEKRKLIVRKSQSRPEYKIKQREWARKRYYLKLDSESRVRYSNSEKGIAASRRAKRKWDDKNPDKIKQKSRMGVKHLKDYYIINKIRRHAERMISASEIRKYPELIEAKRIQIKLKRLTDEKCNRTA